jgi:hypothetical protein
MRIQILLSRKLSFDIGLSSVADLDDLDLIKFVAN